MNYRINQILLLTGKNLTRQIRLVESHFGKDIDWGNDEERVKLASDPSTPNEMLNRLHKDHHEGVRKAVAGNPNASPDILKNLYFEHPKEVESNASTSLYKLEDPNFLKNKVAEIPNTKEGTSHKLERAKESNDQLELHHLYHDNHPDLKHKNLIASRLINNVNTHPETLHHIAMDSTPQRHHAELYALSDSKRDIKDKTISLIGKKTKLAHVLSNLVLHTNASGDTIHEIAKKGGVHIKYNAAFNKKTKPETLEMIYHDTKKAGRPIHYQMSINPNTPKHILNASHKELIKITQDPSKKDFHEMAKTTINTIKNHPNYNK